MAETLKSHLKALGYRALTPWLRHRAEGQHACIGLCYHRFEEEAGRDPIPGMAVTADLFRQQIRALRRMGSFVSVDDLVEGRAEAGLRFFLSFDDGYRDNLTVLLPLLEELQVPCCIYVTSGFVAGAFDAFTHDRKVGFQPAPLDVDGLRELAGSPWVTIGAHTRTHVNLGTCPAELWGPELTGSRHWLEDQLQQPVEHLAYPYGQAADLDWTAAATELPAAGYRSVASNFGGLNASRRMEQVEKDGRKLTHIRRVPVTTSPDLAIYRGWALGLSNVGELKNPRTCLS